MYVCKGVCNQLLISLSSYREIKRFEAASNNVHTGKGSLNFYTLLSKMYESNQASYFYYVNKYDFFFWYLHTLYILAMKI